MGWSSGVLELEDAASSRREYFLEWIMGLPAMVGLRHHENMMMWYGNGKGNEISGGHGMSSGQKMHDMDSSHVAAKPIYAGHCSWLFRHGPLRHTQLF